MFRAQEKYLVVLGAPTSIAQRNDEDTLTYLNKGNTEKIHVLYIGYVFDCHNITKLNISCMYMYLSFSLLFMYRSILQYFLQS